MLDDENLNRAEPTRTRGRSGPGALSMAPGGRAVARQGAAFGMTVLVNTAHPDPTAAGVEFVDRDTAIATADYLSLHTRATAATDG